MIIKLIMLLKSSAGGALVQDIPTSEKTIDDDIKMMDTVLDDLYDAMNTQALVKFDDERLKNFVVNGKYLTGCQYIITDEEDMKEVKKR